MKISIKTMQRTEHILDISGPDATIGEVRAQADSVLGSTGITLIHKGQVLKDDSATLAAVGIVEGEMLVALAKKAKTEGVSLYSDFTPFFLHAFSFLRMGHFAEHFSQNSSEIKHKAS